MSASSLNTSARSRGSRRWMASAIIVLVLLILIFTPPLLNVSRLRRRIAASMSASLGRPVHLDDVSLNLLPFPGFTFQNLVVSEDPAFGSEPMIRANTVTARLRLASLWRRQVEFSSIRFVVDSNGSAPSVNLVRRADGRWNIEGLLVHAAQTDSAPTDQRRAGPAPRFPYIEATGARINIKSGLDKLPFALTEADFALWLPSPNTWKVRLEGRPTRTDVTVSDTGTMRVDATLQRAAHISDVPIAVVASWSAAPLGEQSRMATGSDAGWRGTSEVSATLNGTLGAATLDTTVKLRGLRRTDFIPARMLDLDVHCEASLAVAIAIVNAPQCTLSQAPQHLLSLGETDVPSATLLAWSADSLDLTGLHARNAALTSPGMPADFVLDAVRLATSRIAPEVRPAGTVLASFTGGPAGWNGQASVSLSDAAGVALPKISATATDSVLTIEPVPLLLQGKPLPLTLAGTLTAQGFRFILSGTASPQQIDSLALLAPALADGVDAVAFADNTAQQTPVRINVACERPWWRQQECSAMSVPPAPRATRKKQRR